MLALALEPEPEQQREQGLEQMERARGPLVRVRRDWSETGVLPQIQMPGMVQAG